MTTLSDTRQAVPLIASRHRHTSLYQAVIRRAVQDLAQKKHRDEAREWLLSPESDYAFAAAEISPHSIRQQVI